MIVWQGPAEADRARSAVWPRWRSVPGLAHLPAAAARDRNFAGRWLLQYL